MVAPRATLLLLAAVVGSAWAHGRLIEPPSRGTMWRYGFATPPDYNDHELYCGGYSRQWQKNAGKCGICGDPWDTPTPRAHEAGGTYGQGVIVRRYKRGAAVTVRIELTANHRGYFEFRLCAHNDPRRRAAQACLDQHVLARARPPPAMVARETDALQPHETRYFPGEGNKIFEMRYQLPANLTCAQCIMQWRYVAGNNWGTCANGTGAVGCGPQEEFRACADVAIVDAEGGFDETPYVDENADENVNDVNVDDDDDTTPQRWLVALLVVLSLLAVAVALALVYLYYYHASAKLKGWLRGEHLRKQPVPPPRTKKQPC